MRREKKDDENREQGTGRGGEEEKREGGRERWRGGEEGRREGEAERRRKRGFEFVQSWSVKIQILK